MADSVSADDGYPDGWVPMPEKYESQIFRWKNTIQTGTCGKYNDDLEWAYKQIRDHYDRDWNPIYLDLLMITGDGYMQDYEPGGHYTTAPWNAAGPRPDGTYLDKYHAIFWGDTGDGPGSSNRMDSIGKYAFAYMRTTDFIWTDNNDDEGDASIEFIDDYAFYKSWICRFMSAEDDYKVIEFPYLTRIGSHAFTDTFFTGMDWSVAPNLTEVGEYAFAGMWVMERMTLPNGISEIKEGTFKNDIGLEYVKLPSNLKSIGDYAFENCNHIKTITIPSSVKYIGNGAFKNCSKLESIVLDGDVELGENVFEGCTNLKKVTIKASADISGNVFKGCDSLTKVEIIGNVGLGEGLFEGLKKLETISVSSATSIPDSFAKDCSSLKEVMIVSAKEIGESAFEGCSSLKYFKTYHVEKIGESAFEGCSGLVSIDINNSVTILPEKMLKDCSSLISIKVPDNLKRIASDTFEGCVSLESIVLPCIAENAFSTCTSLKSVELRFGMEEIPAAAFANTAIESLTVPGSVKVIREDAFAGCPYLSTFTLTDGACRVEGGALRDCGSLTTIFCGNGIVFDTDALEGCSGITVRYTDQTTTVPDDAFSGNPGISKVELPSYLKTIGSRAFMGSSVASLSCSFAWLESIGDNAFDGCTLLTGNVTFGVSKLTAVGKEAFRDCAGLTGSVTFPGSTRSIGDRAFEGCTGIDSLNFRGTEFIGEDSFKGCSGIASLTLPYGLKTVSKGAFSDCSRAAGFLMLPSTLQSVGDGAFSGCHFSGHLTVAGDTSFGDNVFDGSSFSSLRFIEGVTTIQPRALQGYSQFTGSLSLPSTLTEVGEYAFEGCAFTGELTVAGDARIGTGAFSGCRFSGITFEEGVTAISADAFKDASEISGKIVLPDSLRTIGANAFSGCTSIDAVEYNGTRWDITVGSDAFSLGTDSVKVRCTVHGAFDFVQNIADYSNSNTLFRFDIADHTGSEGNIVWTIEGDTLTLSRDGSSNDGTMRDFGAKDRPAWESDVLWKNVTKLRVEAGVTSIGESAFEGWKALTDISLSEGVTKIGNSAFRDCSSVLSIELPHSLRTIDHFAFFNCDSLETITIPEGVNSIGNGVFRSCDSIKTVTFPATARNFGSDIFAGCGKLEKIYFMTDSLNMNGVKKTAFYMGSQSSITVYSLFNGLDKKLDKYSDAKIRYMDYYKDSGKEGEVAWYIQDNMLVLQPKSGTATPDYDAGRPSWERSAHWKEVTEVIIADGITYIGNGIFKDCTSIRAAVIPSSVTSIGDMAFYNCKSMRAANLLYGLVSIGDGAFGYCESLESISIPATVTAVGENAFSGCHDVQSIYYKSPSWNIASIGKDAFDLDQGSEPVQHTVYSIGNVAQGMFDGYSGSDIGYADWEKGGYTYIWIGYNGVILQIDEDVSDMPVYLAPAPSAEGKTFRGWLAEAGEDGKMLMNAAFIEGDLDDIGGDDGMSGAASWDAGVAIAVVAAILEGSLIALAAVNRSR